MFDYRKATLTDLHIIWDKDIAANPGDPAWRAWKQQYLAYNQTGQAATFVVLYGREPVGQITVLFSPACSAVKGRPQLCDGRQTANMNAFRIEKPYEGQGHISRLVGMTEAFARARGITRLTIGCEAGNCRNRAIYNHWGYSRLIATEGSGAQQVLYFQKDL